MTICDLMYGLWKMAWAWIPFLIVMVGGAIYEHKKYK